MSVLAATACGGASSGPAPATTATTAGETAPTTVGGDPVVLAAGDIASCSSEGDEATAALLAGRPGTVLALGDSAYETGSSSEYATCYGASWGAEKARTRPAVGNHEYLTDGARGYFAYFGAAAGDAAAGYYSFDLGTWHLIALNSNCTIVSCAAGGPQETWLRADLAAHPAPCTLAYWHHPRFSSGTTHGSDPSVQPLWQALFDAGADVVLEGHEHNYERFGPLTPTGQPDPARGIRSFVVGTGGRNHYQLGKPQPGSEVGNDTTWGVLALTLHPTGFDWQFVPEAGATFTDSGSAACH